VLGSRGKVILVAGLVGAGVTLAGAALIVAGIIRWVSTVQ